MLQLMVALLAVAPLAHSASEAHYYAPPLREYFHGDPGLNVTAGTIDALSRWTEPLAGCVSGVFPTVTETHWDYPWVNFKQSSLNKPSCNESLTEALANDPTAGDSMDTAIRGLADVMFKLNNPPEMYTWESIHTVAVRPHSADAKRLTLRYMFCTGTGLLFMDQKEHGALSRTRIATHVTRASTRICNGGLYVAVSNSTFSRQFARVWQPIERVSKNLKIYHTALGTKGAVAHYEIHGVEFDIECVDNAAHVHSSNIVLDVKPRPQNDFMSYSPSVASVAEAMVHGAQFTGLIPDTSITESMQKTLKASQRHGVRYNRKRRRERLYNLLTSPVLFSMVSGLSYNESAMLIANETSLFLQQDVLQIQAILNDTETVLMGDAMGKTYLTIPILPKMFGRDVQDVLARTRLEYEPRRLFAHDFQKVCAENDAMRLTNLCSLVENVNGVMESVNRTGEYVRVGHATGEGDYHRHIFMRPADEEGRTVDKSTIDARDSMWVSPFDGRVRTRKTKSVSFPFFRGGPEPSLRLGFLRVPTLRDSIIIQNALLGSDLATSDDILNTERFKETLKSWEAVSTFVIQSVEYMMQGVTIDLGGSWKREKVEELPALPMAEYDKVDL